MPDKEDTTEYSQRHQPRHVVNKEGQIQGILLSVVISDEVDWLEVLLELTAHREHREEQLDLVPGNAIDDFVLLLRVEHEMLDDHTSFNQRVDIEFSFEYRLDQSGLLDSSEALELGASCIDEWYVLELVLQLDQ